MTGAPGQVHYELVLELRRTARTNASFRAGDDDSAPPGARARPYIDPEAGDAQARADTACLEHHPRPGGGRRFPGTGGAAGGAAGGAGARALLDSFVVVKDDSGADPGDDGDGAAPEQPAVPAPARGGECKDALGEAWADRVARVRAGSGAAAGVERAGGEWRCRSIIVKSHDDLRQARHWSHCPPPPARLPARAAATAGAPGLNPPVSPLYAGPTCIAAAVPLRQHLP
jgi:hypothetical protein